MKVSKRWTAILLSVCMMISSIGINVQAQSIAEEEHQLQREEEVQDESTQKEETGTEQKQEVHETEHTNQQAVQVGKLNFIMQENSYISIPGEQNIAVSLGQENMTIEEAQLCYQDQNGQELTTEASAIADNMAKFTMAFTEEAQTGIYELVSITYQANGETYQIRFAELDMEVKFGVNQEIDTEPDEMLIGDEVLKDVEANVVTLDENGRTLSENSLQDVLEEAKAESKNSGRAASPSASGSKIIMLDPGHDSTHAGARGNGIKEEEAVLKIAQYCKAELQKYAGVTVYMTRDTNACPNGGYLVTSSDCNAKRVELAVKKKANVYVSFHLNSNVSSVPSGVGVYYPNSNYRPNIGAEGKGLATEIYKKLSALGLSTWAGGILIRNSEDNTLYPDGSLADYLGVIRRSKEAGIPAVLIEHAFLSNAGDANNFLNSDAKLKNLGVADAQAIVGYYGLGQGAGKPEIKWLQSKNSKCLRVKWDPVYGAAGYQVYRSTAKDGKFTKMAQIENNVYDDKKAKPGITYYYKVRAVLSDGSKTKCSKVRSASILSKAELTNVSAKNGKMKIQWKAVEGAKEYELLRSEAANGTFSKIAVISAGADRTYYDKNIQKHKDYFYKIRAVDGAEKKGYSSYSSVVSGWVVKKTAMISVSSQDNTSLLIQWKEVPNADSYKIQRSTKKNGTYKDLAVVKNGQTSYIDTNLKEKKTYYYKVRVFNNVNGKSGYSQYCSPMGGKTITGTTMTYVKSKSTGAMEIKWKKDPSVYAYGIKRSTKKNGVYTKIAEIRDCDITKYEDKKVSGGKRYYYTVECITDKNGVRGYSSASSPKSAVNVPKVEISFIEAGANGITLNWEKAAGSNCYQVMRSTKKSSGFAEIASIESADATSYTDTGVTAGTTYYYRIRAVNKGKYVGYGSYGPVSEIEASAVKSKKR